jgi:hypothetical protein
LAGFLADDYFDFGNDGRWDKARSLRDGYMGEDSNLSEFTMDDIQVKLITDNIALITYQGTYRGTTNGKADQGAAFYSDLYMKRDGKWVSVFTQDSNLKCTGM